MNVAVHSDDRRELHHRHADGIDVRLSWSPRTDAVFVTVSDDAGDSLELAVDPDEALDVFFHPHAYAAARGAATPVLA